LAYSGYREAVLFLYYFNLEPLDWMEERKKLLLNSELFEEIISEESLPFIEQMQIAKIKESFDKKMIKKKILQIDCMSRLLKQNPEISSKKKSNMELLFDQVIRSQSRENLILFVKTFPFNKGIPFITTIAIYF
jgi:hypothetical protein